MPKSVNIVGAYHSHFGKLEDSLYGLYEKAILGALDDAQLEAAAIDGVFLGNYSGGSFNQQENLSPYAINVHAALRHKPTYRVETACSSGSSALHMAMMAIESGRMQRALVVGVEKMTELDIKGVTQALSLATFWPEEGSQKINAPCMFADLAKGWMNQYNYSEQQLQNWLAQVAAKNYEHGSHNPLAQLKKARSAEEILGLPDEKNPMIQFPLRLHDCSLVSDGAAAIILEAGNLRKEGTVAFKGFYNASDYLDSFGKHKSDHFLEGASYAVQQAFDQAGIGLAEIDLAEVHDCFTITELLIYSAIGLTEAGKEFEALEAGLVAKDGKLPINLSGGLKSKGHPIGATGVGMHAYLYKQLMGQAWGIQKEEAKLAMTVNIGGSGTSNAVSVLERIN